jgi:oxalate decarboxylase/phosphoglucose isomerase-like protein (cupin superfamily)
MYQVLEGTLRIALREPNGRWICIGLGPLDMMIIRPGTAHLVESGGSHLTQVIQAPPAGGDQVVVDGERETLAALEVLRRGC